MELLLNTPPSTFALLRRALYYTPDLDGPLIAPWDEARLLDIEAMNRGFKKDQMLVSFKDDGEFVKDLVSLAVDLTNVDRSQAPTAMILRSVRAGILLLNQIFNCGAEETVYKEIETDCFASSVSITHWVKAITLDTNPGVLNLAEIVCKEEARINGYQLLLTLARRAPYLLGENDGVAFLFFFIHHNTLDTEHQGLVFQALIDCVEDKFGNGRDAFLSLKNDWSNVLTSVDSHSPEKLRCTAICIGYLMRDLPWTSIRVNFPRRTNNEEAVIPQWFAVLTLAYHDPALGFSTADFTTVFKCIVRATSDKLGLAILFVESGLVEFLNGLYPIKSDHDFALHAGLILESIGPCWSSVPDGLDWKHLRQSADSLARELELIKLKNPRSGL